MSGRSRFDARAVGIQKRRAHDSGGRLSRLPHFARGMKGSRTACALPPHPSPPSGNPRLASRPATTLLHARELLASAPTRSSAVSLRWRCASGAKGRTRAHLSLGERCYSCCLAPYARIVISSEFSWRDLLCRRSMPAVPQYLEIISTRHSPLRPPSWRLVAEPQRAPCTLSTSQWLLFPSLPPNTPHTLLGRRPLATTPPHPPFAGSDGSAPPRTCERTGRDAVITPHPFAALTALGRVLRRARLRTAYPPFL